MRFTIIFSVALGLVAADLSDSQSPNDENENHEKYNQVILSYRTKLKSSKTYQCKESGFHGLDQLKCT